MSDAFVWIVNPLKGLAPESWLCVDCGVDTAPGCFNRAELKSAYAAEEARGEYNPGIEQTIDARAEIYQVRNAVWKASGMEPMGGCLCIGCLEKRLGRKLRPKDFKRGQTFNAPGWPASQRLLRRQKRAV
jgi:hypothetical protein